MHKYIQHNDYKNYPQKTKMNYKNYFKFLLSFLTQLLNMVNAASNENKVHEIKFSTKFSKFKRHRRAALGRRKGLVSRSSEKVKNFVNTKKNLCWMQFRSLNIRCFKQCHFLNYFILHPFCSYENYLTI